MCTHSCDKVAEGIVTTTKQGKKGLDMDDGEMQAARPRDAVMPCVVSIPVARVVVTMMDQRPWLALCWAYRAQLSLHSDVGLPAFDSSRLGTCWRSAARQAGRWCWMNERMHV
jgi:hypothetical protein